MTSLTLCLHEAALHKNNNELQLRPEGQKGIMWEEKRKGKEKKKNYDDKKKIFFFRFTAYEYLSGTERV